MKKSKKIGTVYLLHLKDKLSNRAQHYIGWTTDLKERIARHKAGNGSAMMTAVKKAGIDFVVAQVWNDVDRHFERSLKNRKHASRFCPICKNQKQEVDDERSKM